MSAKERPIIKQVFDLLRRIGIPPSYLAFPVLLSLLTAAVEGASMGLLIPLLNGFLQKNFGFAKDVPILGALIEKLPASVLANDRLLFAAVLGCFIMLFLTKNILRYSTVLSIAYFSERALHHLRKALFARYLSFGKLFFDKTNVGHHSTLLLEFAHLALRPVGTIDKYMNSLFSLAAYFVVMISISWKLTLVALPLFVVLHFTVKSMIIGIKKLSYAIADKGSALGKKSVEILSTIPLVKSSRMEKEEQGHYTLISNDKAKMDFRARALQEMILPLQEIITICAAAVIFFGALYVFGRDGIASAPAIMVYFYMVMNASSKFGTLSGFRGTLAAASGPLHEVTRIFNEEGKFFVRGGSKTFAGIASEISCRDLSFSYGDERTVLRSVSCVLRKGEMTAVVGPTGAGKSTLIHLLMRYYDCPPNSIFIDGVDIREFTLESYLEHVALVSQETLLLHESLRNNILYGMKRQVSDAEMQRVLHQSRLTDFVKKLPQGVDTLIGDRGVRLSGGEKQRVSIARALLKGADILILDEATSSLDSETEKLIQEAIDEAVQGRTSIVIAHRLSTIRNADIILVLEDGAVVEEGKLEDLLEHKGTFHRLWEQQKF
ncbi:ABC transporter ATP-binding protein [Candidatus Peribacteria bacterium]|nr:ABC transporter ATP-binding protein [Candidatus Peribacteria bacterium]